MSEDELLWLDATAQAELVARGEITPAELVAAAIARVEATNQTFNAVIHPRFERALREAKDPPRGSFRGVPMVVKDLVCTTAGDPYHCGMRLLRDLGWTEREDSYTAAKLRAAGFVFVGRTNTPELGLMPTTEPEAYGPTRNPWNTAHSTGGSSGGSAAAVASGMVALGHATDGGGSIRIPASACGLVGLKPSRGRVSAGPRMGEGMAGFSGEHVLTRSVRDSAAVLDVLRGRMPGDPPGPPPPLRPYVAELQEDLGRLRVGLMVKAPGGATAVHADCVAAAEDAARLLERLGHHVEEAHPPALDELEHIVHFGAVTGADAAALLHRWSARTGSEIGPDDVELNTWTLAEMGRAITAPQLLASIEWIAGYRRRIAAWFDAGFDLLLTPTLAEPPPRLGEFVATPENPLGAGLRGASLVPFTPPWNSTGQPAISLPLHWNDAGLPIGVQLVAAYGREDELIRIAAQLEAAQPWADRRPPG
ncbi:MAG: amidase [Actinomycetota bacterium]